MREAECVHEMRDGLGHVHFAQSFEDQRCVPLVGGAAVVEINDIGGSRRIERRAESVIASRHHVEPVRPLASSGGWCRFRAAAVDASGSGQMRDQVTLPVERVT